MHQNLILIKGGAYTDTKKALQCWLQLYADQLEKDLLFHLHKNGRGKHCIKADERLNNELFFYLVNYLAFAEGIHGKAEVQGFTMGRNHRELTGKPILVTIIPNNTGYDCVLVTTPEQINYKINFVGKVIKMNNNQIFQEPPMIRLTDEEVLVVPLTSSNQAGEMLKHIEQVDWRMRILVVALLASMAAFIGLLVAKSEESQSLLVLFSGIGLFTWFFLDYKLLQNDTYYRKCLALATAYLSVNLWFDFATGSRANLCVIAFAPLITLALQWPLRRIFKKQFQREPIVDKYAGKISDAFYSMLLLAGAMFGSYSLGELAKNLIY